MKILSFIALLVGFIYCHHNTLSASSKSKTALMDTPITPQFLWKLTLTRSEKSKDSHSSAAIYTLLENDVLTYDYTTKGARSKAPISKQWQLTDIQIDQLTKLLEHWKLNKSYKKEYKKQLSNSKSGIWRQYTWTLETATQTIKIVSDNNDAKDEVLDALNQLQHLLDYLVRDQSADFDKFLQSYLTK